MSGAESELEPKSPCISVCVLDDDNICMGCYRSSEEITDWFMASKEQKREVLRKAKTRLDASFGTRLG